MRKITTIVALLLVVLSSGIWLYNKWKAYEEKDRLALEKEKAWAISKVQLSRYGTQQARDQAASDFLKETTTTDTCDWDAHPMWGAGYKNPSWFSSVKGSTGFHVVCETTAHNEDETDLEFEWDYIVGEGVVSFRWGYSYSNVAVDNDND